MTGKRLQNNIVLPDTWPPRIDKLTRRPPGPPPYLLQPPEVICVDVGRQLFVDDFLIEHTTLTRTYHRPQYIDDNPVLRPDRPWEHDGGPTAMVFSDGVWWDPSEGLFKMWYMGGYGRHTCYAVSHDGVQWHKPQLDVVPGTNIVHTRPRDSATIWLDHTAPDPGGRYKLFVYQLDEHSGRLSIYLSPDGIHWSPCAARSGPCGDRTTVFYNPFADVWVFSLREYLPQTGLGRCRRYWQARDALSGARWQQGEPTLWVGADDADPRRPDLNVPPELYNLDAVAYESLLVGLFTIWYGQPDDRAKPNEIFVGFSRDGFYWHRPWREPFIGVSERFGDWNWANVQSAGGCLLVVGDHLYFYVSGRAGVQGSPQSGRCSTGLAVLRRDGFASMDAGKRGGVLTTRPLQFSGRYLFVNADAAGGELRVEVVGPDGQPIGPYSADACRPVTRDATVHPVTWRDADDLSRLAGQPVRLRFWLRSARLYSFWITSDPDGASGGYVAAGGPGFDGPRDD